MQNEIVAVIPVRSDSRRLRNKNISPFNGVNLLTWKIAQLKQVKTINNIIVSSDSEEMLEMALDAGVNIHKRSSEYCDEKSKSFGEVVQNICQNITGINVLWATCTSPLVEPSDYEQAISTYFKELENGFDSLMSVNPFKRYIWNDEGPLNYQLGLKHVPSQELKNLYYVTDGILLAPRQKMIEWAYFHGIRPYMFQLSRIKSIDIDDQLDLDIANAWLKYINNSEN